jgi:1-acyl-sn-glycerol-3-phosphate acyltransferase
MGPLARLLGASELLRYVYTTLLFAPVVPLALLFSVLGRPSLMVLVWRGFAAGMGLTSRVHGELPPRGVPSVWLSNHFNWFDWPVLQVSARRVRHAHGAGR